MIELIGRARWDQAYDFLASGDPPMISRILALNTIFFIFLIVRRAKGVSPLKQTGLIQVQALLVVANLLIFFQSSIIQFLDRFI
jgi:hypothetical protein